VRLWDIEQAKEGLKVEGHEDTIQSVSWSYDTSHFATSSKDKFIRIIDPRTNKVVHKLEGHDGAKGFKVTYMGNEDKLMSVGFSKISDRVIKLWDLKNLSKCVSELKVDSGSGLITPYYDPDTGVAFMCGKGDGNIKMFEVNNEEPYIHYLTTFESNVPSNGIALLPKKTNNVRECEIASWLKLTGDYVEPIHFSVPRTRMELFQDDLFPPTRDTAVPVMTANEWFGGMSKTPATLNLQPQGMQLLSEVSVEKKEKKYDFKTEVAKDDSKFSKDKFLSSYYNTMTGQHGESTNTVLKQDLMEGATSEEWD